MLGSLPLLLALGGCGGSPGLDQFPDLATPGSGGAISLHTQPGRYTLDPPAVPGADALEDSFALEVEEIPNPQGAKRVLRVLRAKLPFNAPGGRFAPPGMSLTIDGEPIAFSKGKAARAKRSSWRINGKHIVLSHPEIPEPGTVVASWSGLRSKLDRHDPARSELPLEEFVRHHLTLAGQTRHGLMLPAPATAEWDLTLPATTTELEAWLALERAPLPEPVPDPATLVLSVVVAGQTTEVARQQVRRDDPGFQRWTADLSAFAGQAITLRLTADPEGNPWFDWLFVGSPTVRTKPSTDVRRVVVLAMDTTRPDHLGFYGYKRGNTADLDAIGRQSVTFDRAWSVAPRTRPAFRSAATGRLPLDAVGAPNLAELLQAEGWATAGVVANVHLQPRFDFDHGFDWWHYDNNADAELQVERGLAWLTDHRDQDSFLFLHLMDPHLPYRAPGEWQDAFVTDPDPDLPARFDHWAVNKWTTRKTITAQRKAHIEALHDGEMAYMSHQIGRFAEGLDALPGRTLLVLHTDHGEEFWEHGAFEHNHQLYDETTRMLLWFRPGPGLRTGRRISEPASILDLAPTLATLLGLSDPPEMDGRPLTAHLEGSATPDADRAIPVAYNQYQRERWAVVFREHKYILHTWTGREELYHLGADPQEQANLAASTELGPWREALAAAHEVPVHPGLRLFLELSAETPPLKIELPDPALAAGVFDPEVGMEHRANQEWGEPPKRVAADFGTVELSTDGRSLMVTPGPNPRGGAIWIQDDAPISPSAIRLTRDGKELPLAQTPDGWSWGDHASLVRVVPGTVLVPPPGEASRMRALRGEEGVDAAEMEKLRQLGYVEHEQESPE